MTNYYWEKLRKVADFALNKMRSIRTTTRVGQIRWDYYNSIVQRTIKEREEEIRRRVKQFKKVI